MQLCQCYEKCNISKSQLCNVLCNETIKKSDIEKNIIKQQTSKRGCKSNEQVENKLT